MKNKTPIDYGIVDTYKMKDCMVYKIDGAQKWPLYSKSRLNGCTKAIVTCCTSPWIFYNQLKSNLTETHGIRTEEEMREYEELCLQNSSLESVWGQHSNGKGLAVGIDAELREAAEEEFPHFIEMIKWQLKGIDITRVCLFSDVCGHYEQNQTERISDSLNKKAYLGLIRSIEPKLLAASLHCFFDILSPSVINCLVLPPTRWDRWGFDGIGVRDFGMFDINTPDSDSTTSKIRLIDSHESIVKILLRGAVPFNQEFLPRMVFDEAYL